MDGIDFVGYLVGGFLERTDVYGRGRDSVERQIRSLVESIEAKDYRRLKDVLPVASNKGSRWVKEREDEKERERMERDARLHECLHGYEGECPLEKKKIEVLR